MSRSISALLEAAAGEGLVSVVSLNGRPMSRRRGRGKKARTAASWSAPGGFDGVGVTAASPARMLPPSPLDAMVKESHGAGAVVEKVWKQARPMLDLSRDDDKIDLRVDGKDYVVATEWWGYGCIAGRSGIENDGLEADDFLFMDQDEKEAIYAKELKRRMPSLERFTHAKMVGFGFIPEDQVGDVVSTSSDMATTDFDTLGYVVLLADRQS